MTGLLIAAPPSWLLWPRSRSDPFVGITAPSCIRSCVDDAPGGRWCVAHTKGSGLAAWSFAPGPEISKCFQRLGLNPPFGWRCTQLLNGSKNSHLLLPHMLS